LKLLLRERVEKHGNASKIATRAIETLHQAEGYGVDGVSKNNWDAGGCCLGRQHSGQSRRSDYVDFIGDEVGGKLG